MKKLFLNLIIILLFSSYAYAQVPQGFNYQGQARNSDGPIRNSTINLRFSILNGSTIGAAEYTETQTLQTNGNGSFSTVVGNGLAVIGNFSGINWVTGNKFLKVEIDPNGGSNFVLVGTTQLLSVPYALYAEKSGNTLIAGEGISINGNTITNSAKSQWQNNGNNIFYNNGNVGIGTNSPSKLLEISGTSTPTLRINSPNSSIPRIQLSRNTEDNKNGWNIDNNGNLDFSFFGTFGSIGTKFSINPNFAFFSVNVMPNQGNLFDLGSNFSSWRNIYLNNAPVISSDRRLKEHIQSLKYGLNEILQLNPVNYYLKNDTQKSLKLGLIAQEVQSLIPEIVSVGTDTEKTLGLQYSDLIPVLIKAIQEQQIQIEILKQQNLQLMAEK